MTPNPDWQALAQTIVLPQKMWIEGKEQSAATTFAVESPIDGRVLTEVSRGMKEDIHRAVESARQAFNDGRWRRQSPQQRKKVLLKWSQLMMERRDELALIETLDMGKPISNARSADVPASARCLAWYAEAIDKVYGEIAPTEAQSLALIHREPMGVIGAIVPWNYPMLMASWKIAPALAMGNSLVLKPSEKSPLSALYLARLALEAGLPAGVFNVVPGFGHEAGEALAMHMGVDAIGFTGSTRTGRRMLEYSGQSNLKRVYNELGGKSAFIIFEDFHDLARAAKTLSASIFYNQGESCNAPTRLLVHESIAQKVIDIVLAETAHYQPKNPLDSASTMGALVDKAQLNTVMHYINTGKNEGAKCLAGGHSALTESGGYYVAPTVFDQVQPGMKIEQEEIFGPVVSIIRFKTEEEAIAIANGTSYGLHAALWSDNLSRAHRVARALQAGTVHVNQYDEDDITVPFGGVKQSGNGRDKSLHALEKYTELKTVWIKLEA